LIPKSDFILRKLSFEISEVFCSEVSASNINRPPVSVWVGSHFVVLRSAVCTCRYGFSWAKKMKLRESIKATRLFNCNLGGGYVRNHVQLWLETSCSKVDPSF
jgi:hypothetical protein